MTVNKLSLPAKENAVQLKINEIIDNLGGGGTATDVQINGTTITANNVANIRTNGTYNASSNKIATMSDLPDISNCANTTLSNLSTTSSTNFDGQWLASKIDLPSMGTNVGTYKYNLKNQSGTGITAVNYLPNDNYQYEVSLHVYSSNTSYSGSTIYVYSDIVSGNATVSEKSTSKYGTANIILPVSSLLTVEIASNRVNHISVTLIGYRRIGTNS